MENKGKLILGRNWIDVMFEASFMAQRHGHQEIKAEVFQSFEIWCSRRMERIKWPEKVTNEQLIERIGEKRTLLNNILRRKSN